MNIVQWLIMTQLSEANKNYTIKYNAPPLNGSLSLSLSLSLSRPRALYLHHLDFVTIPWSKVLLSLPAQKRECGIFGPDMVK